MNAGARRRTIALAGVLAVAIKLGYFFDYTQLPFLQGPLFDSAVYLRQARAVLEGDFGHATLLAFSPLYGYVLALVGGDRGIVLAVVLQLGLGLASLALVFRIAERAFDDTRAAFAAAALYLGYGLFLFYETKILSETLGIALLVTAWFLYMSPRFVAGQVATAAGAGAVAALAILARASLLFTAPFFVLIALLPWSRTPAEIRPSARPRLVRAAAFAAGLGVVLLANGAWNAAHTGFFVPVIFTSQTVASTTSTEWRGDLSALSTHANGDVSAWDVVRQARDRMRRREEGRESDADSAIPRIDLAGLIRGAPAKLAGTFGDTETTFDYGYYGERSEIRALSVLPVSFGMIALLAVVGAICLVRRDGARALLPFLPIVLGVVTTTVLFHPSSRYRLPMVLPLVVLAGYAPFGIALLPWSKPRRILLGAVLGVVCALFAVRTLTYPLREPALWELRVAESAAVSGDSRELDTRLARARSLGAERRPETRRRLEYVERLAGRARALTRNPPDSSSSRPSSP